MLIADLQKIINSQDLALLGISELQQAIGRAIPSNKEYDPDGIYSATTGLNLASRDYKPLAVIRGFTLGAAGAMNVTWINGSTETLDLSGASVGDINQYFLGYMLSINKTGTTATGIKPLF